MSQVKSTLFAPILRLKPLFKNDVQLIYVQRFNKVVIATGGKRRCTVGGIDMPGQEDYGDSV